MEDESRKRIEIFLEITQEEARDFLTKLAYDDDFRDRLQKDPRSVLVEYRIEINDEGLPMNAELPPKDHVQQLLQRTDEYGAAAAMPLGYGWMVIVLGFAMPLVAGDPPE